MPILINLPMPPSVNHLYANAGRKGRVISAEYTAWLTAAGWELKTQRPGRVSGFYEISVYIPAKTKGDLGNREKAVADLLVKHGVIDDDRFAWAIHMHRDLRIEGGCQVVLRAVSDAERDAA